MTNEWEPLELLRHSRHDWLNDIQIIKANLAMNRVERAKEAIETVTARAHSESKLTNLRMPGVAEMLLTFNWKAHFYHLQVEVIGKVKDLSHCERELSPFLEKLLENVDQDVDRLEENQLLLTFLLNEEGQFLTVDFSGRLVKAKFLDEGWIHKTFPINEHQVKEDQFILTVQLP